MDSYKITFEAFDNKAKAYQEKFMNLELYNDTYDLFCELITSSTANILEIGCGPGNITKYLLSQKPSLNVTGIDVAPNMIELAKKNNPTASFKVMDCRNVNQLQQKYHGIICGFCMPYLSQDDCAKLFKYCNALLVDEGIAYFSTIEGDYANSGFELSSDGTHKAFVYYYHPDFIKELLVQNGFTVVELIKKQYPKGETISTHLIFIARKVNRVL